MRIQTALSSVEAAARRTALDAPSVGRQADLLPHEHRLGLALQVPVGLAADVDGDELERPAAEVPGPLSRIVVGDRCHAAPDREAGAADAEHAGLGLDALFAHLLIAVVEGEDAG